MKQWSISMGIVAGLAVSSCDKPDAGAKDRARAGQPAMPTVTVNDEDFILAVEGDPVTAWVGRQFREESTNALGDATLILETQGVKMEGTTKETVVRSLQMEVLAANRVRQVIRSGSSEGVVTVEGQDQVVAPTGDPLLDVPVMVTREEGTWTATLESGSPTGEQEAGLKRVAAEFQNRRDAVLYGTVRRKPGERWTVDVGQLVEFAGARELSGTFDVEFLEVREVRGVPCGVFRFLFQLSGKPADGKGEEDVKTTLEGTADVVRSLTDLVDLECVVDAATVRTGSAGGEGSMTVSGRLRHERRVKVSLNR